MKSTRFAVIVGSLLLIVASEAGAECAWVLWTDLKLFSKGTAAEEWQVGGGYTSRDACFAAARFAAEVFVFNGAP